MIPEQAIVRVQQELKKYNVEMPQEFEVIKLAVAKLTMIQSVLKVDPETMEEATTKDIEIGKKRANK